MPNSSERGCHLVLSDGEDLSFEFFFHDKQSVRKSKPELFNSTPDTLSGLVWSGVNLKKKKSKPEVDFEKTVGSQLLLFLSCNREKKRKNV